MWDDIGILAGYNTSVDADVIAVAQEVAKDDPPPFMTEIAQRTGLGETHVELIQYILCERLCEYGSSPRCCWPIDRKAFKQMVDRWQAENEKER